MKKLYSILMLGVMLAFASCTKEQNLAPQSGKEVDARISVQLPAPAAKTRAAFDNPAFSDMRVVMAVMYNDVVVHSETKTNQGFGDGTTAVNFDLRLVTGQNYKIAVWADFGESYYTLSTEVGAAPKVTLASTTLKGSNNKYDAYFKIDNVTFAAANEVKPFVLKRPFGLVKINTTDNEVPTVVNAGLRAAFYQIATINAPTELSLLDGNVSKNEDLNVELSSVSDAVGDGNPKELSFDYFLAGETQSPLSDFTVAYKNAENKDITAYDFTNIPLRRNYITNITGNILTKMGSINVTLDPMWEGTTESSMDVETLNEVNTILNGASQNNSSVDVKVTGEVAGTSNTITIPEAVMASNTPVISLDFSKVASGAKIVITDAVPASASSYDGDIQIRVPAGVAAADIEIKTVKAHVTVCGSYGQIIAQTSPSTLVVDDDAVVESLVVEEGNVEVLGQVKQLSISAGNSAQGTIFVSSNGSLDEVSNAGNYKFTWGASTGAQLLDVLAKPASMNHGVVLESDVEVNAPSAQAAIKLNKEGYTFDGKGHIVKGQATQNIMIITALKVCVSDVVIEKSPKHAITVYEAYTTKEDYAVVLKNVTVRDSKAAGLIVNGSTVKAENFKSSGNGWYGVNVGRGSGVTEQPSFTLVSGEINDRIQIKVDAKDVGNATVKVGAGWNVISAIDGSLIYTTQEVTLFSGGKGTYEEPYLISTKADIMQIGTMYMAGAYDKIYSAALRMTNDIDMESTPIRNLGVMGFLFDGNGYTLKNVNFTSESTFGAGNNVGMFSSFMGKGNEYIYEAKDSNDPKAYSLNGKKYIIKGGCIRDLTIEGRVYSNIEGVVSALGCGQNTGYIINVTNRASVTAEGSAYFVAGIISGTRGTGLVLDCKNYGDITVTGGDESRPVGGITAQLYGGSACNGTYPDILAPYSASVNNCVNYGTITANCKDVGGIVGQTHGYGGLKCVANSRNEGAITGTTNVGGILGRHSNTGGTMSVAGSTNTGAITATAQDGVKDNLIGKTEGATQQ